MRKIELFFACICASLILSAVAINFSNVIGRYVFLNPFSWVEEVLVYMNIWMVFLGSIIVSLRNKHLNIDIFRHLIPKFMSRFVSAIITAATGIVCVIVAWISYGYVDRVHKMGQQSISLEIPMYIPHLAVFVGFSMMSLATVIHLVRLLAGKRVDDGDAERSS